MSNIYLNSLLERLQNADTDGLRGNYEQARATALQVVELVNTNYSCNINSLKNIEEEISSEYRECHNLLAYAYHILGTTARYQSDYDSAVEWYEKSLIESESVGDMKLIARAFGNLGVTKGLKENYIEDIELTTKALELDTSIDNKRGMAMWQNNLGIAYGRLGDYSKALNHFMIAVNLDEQTDNTVSRATRYNNIGIVYEHLGDYEKALDYFQRSIGIDEELGNRKGIAQRLSNMGMAYSHLNNSDLAIECFTKALAIDEELVNNRGKAIRLSNLADEFASRGEYNIALEYQIKALALDKELQNTRGCAIRLASIGTIIARRIESEEDIIVAEKYLLEGLALSQEIENKHHVLLCHKELADIYERQGRLQESILNFKQFYKLEKEVLSEEAKRHAQNAEQQRIMRERDKQFELVQAKATATIEATNKLLHNVLPPSIADKMLACTKRIAEKLSNVSVLFADIVEFTKLSQRISPEELVEGLDRIFSVFDTLAEKHGLEKIKTIGDAYMVVSGAPEPRADHAEAMALMAVEMLEAIKQFKSISTGEEIQLRIGIHSGDVVAGVIGKKKFTYDLWGDAVNTASRMESHGEAGRIHVSEEFKNAVGESSFNFINRGEMDIKGKGIMKTFFLEKKI
ncbi:MAG: tetratricopeptide repeat protein [Bacteroidetes bacterium]|nr:tetratricopeptide repeat protein [Bacteroidota bacterium]